MKQCGGSSALVPGLEITNDHAEELSQLEEFGCVVSSLCEHSVVIWKSSTWFENMKQLWDSFTQEMQAPGTIFMAVSVVWKSVHFNLSEHH